MATHIRNRTLEAIAVRAKTVWDWAVAQIVLGFLALIRRLPAEKSTNGAERLGRFLSPVLPRTRLAKRNMALAFPEKSEAEIAAMARGMWGHVARTIAEYVFLDELFDFDYENPDAGRVRFEGIERFLAVRDSDRPIILFTAHTGNWEILPVGAAAYDLHVTAMFRPPNNRFLAKHLLEARTTGKGHLVPSRAGAAWALADVLAANGAIGLLADQAFTRGPHIEFLGREATANPIAAKLARQFNADIYPARCVRQPGGKFLLELGEKLDPARDERGNLDVVGTTKRINAVIEGWVREYPEQWLWLHNRWKIKGPEKAKWRR